MYFRHKQTNSGIVLQLVESFRNDEGQPRQRVRLSLGNAPLPESIWPEVARGIDGRLTGQASLFHPSAEVGAWIDQLVRRLDSTSHSTSKSTSPKKEVVGQATVDGVLIDSVTHGDCTPLGPSLAALHAWSELKMPTLLSSLGFNDAQQKALVVNVINRLIDPVSENALLQWQSSSSLPELLGWQSLPTSNDRFYRTCDLALKHKESIAAHLRQREASYFSLDRTIVLYDLTNTYFEGEMKKNDKAKRGNSKEKRNDCPQVVVGVVFDQHGFELAHEIFEGNKNDAASMIEMVTRLQEVTTAPETKGDKPLVIIDGGIASAKNRQCLQAAGMNFLANESRPGRKKYQKWFDESDAFSEISGRKRGETVLVRSMKDPLAESPEEADTLIFCKSAGRMKKEQAILSRAEERFLAAVAKLQERIEKGRLKKEDKIERVVGRLLAKNPRVARYYSVTFADKQLTCKRDDESYKNAENAHGCYVLRTSSDQLEDAEDWWNLYITLTKAEAGFRSLKSDLGLRPIRHHREDRGDSHIFISILAYHLLQFITYALQEKGDYRSWETIKRVLATHCYTTIMLPTIKGELHRLRKPGLPDNRQKEIYDRIGIKWQGLPAMRTVG